MTDDDPYAEGLCWRCRTALDPVLVQLGLTSHGGCDDAAEQARERTQAKGSRGCGFGSGAHDARARVSPCAIRGCTS
jgi:hypothetical protein